MNALIATDGSEASQDALRVAAELMPDDTALILLTVVPRPLQPEDDAGGFEGPLFSEEEARDEARSEQVSAAGALAATASVLGARPVEQRVREGEAGQAICDEAKELGVDIVVVGSHDKGPIARALLGSVSDYVVHHSPCPVLVVR